MPEYSPQRHRHFVALPIILAVVLLSLLANFQLHQDASVLTSSSDIIIARDGTEIIPGAVTTIDTDAVIPSLHQGSGLFQNDGILRVQTPVGTVLGLAGTVFISVNNRSSVSVVPITSPVSVTTAKGTIALIPVGYQMMISANLPDSDVGIEQWMAHRKLQDVPPAFLREQLLALDRFPHANAFLPEAHLSLPSAESTHVLLPEAASRAEDRFRQQILGSFRGGIETKDFSHVRDLLAQPRFQFALTDPASSTDLIALTSSVPLSERGIRTALLSSLSAQPNLWIVAALHPVLRDAVWSLSSPVLSMRDRLLLATVLPYSDSRSVALPSAIYAQWRDLVHTLVPEVQDLLTTIVEQQLLLVRRFVAEQYPERASTLLGMLRSLVSDDVVLSERFAADFHSADESITGDIAASQVSSVSSSAQSSLSSATTALPTLSLAALHTRAHEMLTDARALFTTEMAIVPIGGDRVHVAGILFAGADGDHAYSFDLDVVSGQVSTITKDGVALPYPLAFDKFAEWVRK